MELFRLDDKNVRVILHSGEVFEGEARHLGGEYCFHEYGREEEALEIIPEDDSAGVDSWLFYESDIARAEVLETDAFGEAAPLRIFLGCRDDFVTTSWSGGVTTQFLIYPRDEDYAARSFLWRISSAVVEDSESDFTPLPDYMRYITPLAGPMTLRWDGGEGMGLNPYEIFLFDGAGATHSEGVCTDFNLMLRKDKARGSMERIRLGQEPQALPLASGIRDVLLFCPEGDCLIHTPYSEIHLPAGEILIGENAGNLKLSAESKTPARLLLAQAGAL